MSISMSDTFFAVWLGVDKRLEFLEFSGPCQKPQTHNSGEKIGSGFIFIDLRTSKYWQHIYKKVSS